MPTRPDQDRFADLREAMVARQIAPRGITDPAVLEALRRVPRERFVPAYLTGFAYEDGPLSIGEGQTISQPYVVAAMVAALRLSGGERVLEVGTGSGYAAAVLAEIAGEVHTVERLERLAVRARRLLHELGYANVHVHHGDGTLGWPDAAPYDGIVVAAGAPAVPEALREQLADGGRLVIPVGPTPDAQRLLQVHRRPDGTFAESEIAPVRFVRLIGAQGWDEGYRPF